MSTIALRMASWRRPDTPTTGSSTEAAAVEEAIRKAHERGTGRNRRERGCVPPGPCHADSTTPLIESVWGKATSLRPLTCSYERSPVGFPHRF